MNKTQLFAVLLTTIGIFACTNNTSEETIQLDEPKEVQGANTGERYTITPAQCEIKWEGKKLTRKHYGSVFVKEGFVMIDDGRLTGGQLMIDMNSMADLSQTGSSKTNLESHLKSDEFFDVEKHPYASFTITKTAKYLGDDNANTLIYGNLTIKGISKSTQLKAKVVSEGNQVSVQAPKFKFDRAEFDIRYDSASFFDDLGDKAIDDEIALSISIVAAK